MSLDKPFNEINQTDLKELIENGTPERKNIEYKESLPDSKYDSKKEFLADVSSFANTIGGDILYGIKEENGLPISLIGIPNSDFDSEILRLENLLRDNIQPRIQGISIRTVTIESSNPVLLIHVPQSWSKPHVVNFQGHWRFYARNSAGKYPLDVMELKSAFLATTALGERIRTFHFDRLSKISSDEIPVSLMGKARTIFHLIPYSAFESSPLLNFETIEKDIWSILLMRSSVSSYRYNLDGLIVYSEKENNLSNAYAQIFRNGIFESVSTSLFVSSTEDPHIPSIVFERELINSFESCATLYRKLQVSMPAVLMVSLIGVRGYKLGVSQMLNHEHVNKIDRDTLLLPEIIIEDFGIDPATTLRPILDALWNSAGWARSYGYDDAGKWGKGPNFR
jgi:hypothetical protein